MMGSAGVSHPGAGAQGDDKRRKEGRGRDNVGSQDFGLGALMGTFKGSVRSHYDLVLLAYQLQFVFNDCLSDQNTALSATHTETAPEHNCSRGPGGHCIRAPALG